MKQQVKKIKIFISYLTDVIAERAYLQQAVDEINAMEEQCDIIIERLKPDRFFGPTVNSYLSEIDEQIRQCDIFVGIVWKSLNIHIGDNEYDSKEIFENGFKSGIEDHTRHTIFFFCEDRFTPKNQNEIKELSEVIMFRERIDQHRFGCAYSNADSFLPVVKMQLQNMIGKLISVPSPENEDIEQRINVEKKEFKKLDGGEINPSINCSLALAYGKQISPQNYIDMHSQFRHTLVAGLAQQEKYSAEAIIPVPHAGVFLATCWSEIRPEQHLWLAFGYAKVDSAMFKLPGNTDERIKHADTKVSSIVEDNNAKSVILIDEAVLSGSSMKQAVKTLRGCGVEKIYIRTLLPPLVKACPYNVITYKPGMGFDKAWQEDPQNFELVAQELEADNYASLSKKEIQLFGAPRKLCIECFS